MLLILASSSGQPDEEEPLVPDGGKLVLDIKAAREAARRQRIERCTREEDAARVAGEIVVCRRLSEGSGYGFNKRDWERRYAQATQGVKPVNVDGSGLRAPDGSPMQPLVGTGFGKSPEQPLIIDVEALPEAPPGSDADRIARGLPPRGQ